MRRVERAGGTLDRLWLEISERRKIEDPRRKAIYESVYLTKEQEKAIDAFYLTHYGRKVPHKWHRLYTAYTGRFDEKYIPELLFIPRVEKTLNPKKYLSVLGDKNLLSLVLHGAKSFGLRAVGPEEYVSCASGILRDDKNEFISLEKAALILEEKKRAFVKPSIDTSSGRNCLLLDVQNGVDKNSGRAVLEILRSMGDNCIAQQVVKCSDSIRALNPTSVNTFRVITYILEGAVYAMPVILRIGRLGKTVDNAHAGGMFIAVSDGGALHKTAFTEFREAFDQHPDTGAPFEGHVIEGYDEMLEDVKALHRTVPQLGMISWDVTIDDRGRTVIIEANVTGQAIWLTQMAHGVGGFGENTAAMLEKIAPGKKR